MPTFLKERKRMQRKKKESYLNLEELLNLIKVPRIQEGEIEMLSATIVIERVTMLEIVPKREFLQEETLQGPTKITVASTTTGIEEGIKEEETPPIIVKIIIVHQRGQGTPSIKEMLLINLNIFLFPHYLVHLLQILGIVGWLIVGPHITSLNIRRFSLIW